MNTTNTRREDILKTAKYHYKVDGLDTVEVMRRVIAHHNGVTVERLNDYTILTVMMHDLNNEVMKEPRALKQFINNMWDDVWWSCMLDPETPTIIRTMLLSYLHLVTMLERKYINNESLPDNCPAIQKMLDN